MALIYIRDSMGDISLVQADKYYLTLRARGKVRVERCNYCGRWFDIERHDNSGYRFGKEICAPCFEDLIH